MTADIQNPASNVSACFLIYPEKLGFKLYADQASLEQDFNLYSKYRQVRDCPIEAPFMLPDSYPVWARKEYVIEDRYSGDNAILTYLYPSDLEPIQNLHLEGGH